MANLRERLQYIIRRKRNHQQRSCLVLFYFPTAYLFLAIISQNCSAPTSNSLNVNDLPSVTEEDPNDTPNSSVDLTRVVVDVSKSKVPIAPSALSPLNTGLELSQWGRAATYSYPHDKIHEDLAGALFRTGLSLAMVASDEKANDLESYMKILSETLDPIIVKHLNGSKKHLILTLYGMPRWISSQCTVGDTSQTFICQKNWIQAPPKDLGLWSTLVSQIVSHYNVDLKLDLYYEVWNEADQGFLFGTKDFWVGNQEQYHALYETSVLAARSVDPNCKVGGPGSSVWNKGVIEKFLTFASQKKLPVDFVSWHVYTGWNDFSATRSEYHTMVAQVRRYLNNSGFDPKTSLIIDEWNNGPGHDQVSKHTTESTAAYAVYSINAMWRAGITAQTFMHAIDWNNAYPLFSGNTGTMSNIGLIKPVFNAFKMISMVNGNINGGVRVPLKVRSTDELVAAISTRTETSDEVGVLISNFIPDKNLLYDMMKHKVVALNSLHWQRCRLEESHSDDYCLLEVISNPEDSAEKEISDFYRKGIDYQTRPRSIKLRMKNLPFSGVVKITSYLTDKSFSNSCRLNKATEKRISNSPCGENGEITQMVLAAQSQALSKTKELTDLLLAQDGYTEKQRHDFLKNIVAPCENSANYFMNCVAAQAAGTAYGRDLALKRRTNSITDQSDIFEKLKRSDEIFQDLFFTGMYNSQDIGNHTIELSMTSINADPRIALDGSKSQDNGHVSEDGLFEKEYLLQPNSVLLLMFSPN